MFTNWTRKIAGLAAVVITLVALAAAAAWIFKPMLPNLPPLADWAAFAEKVAWSFGIVAGISKVGSVASDAVAGLKAKGVCPPAPPEQ